jgi:hypothetical protein
VVRDPHHIQDQVNHHEYEGCYGHWVVGELEAYQIVQTASQRWSDNRSRIIEGIVDPSCLVIQYSVIKVDSSGQVHWQDDLRKRRYKEEEAAHS